MSSILVVDDEPGVRAALSGVLRDEGYRVDAVESGEACLERLGRQPYDVVVLDVWLPGMDGLATLTRMRERDVDSTVVMISGHGSVEPRCARSRWAPSTSWRSRCRSTRPCW
jgi:two-component system nitrogen regulation response regulator NtrX